MLCTFTTMAIVGEVLRFGHLEELFGFLSPVHDGRVLGMSRAWKMSRWVSASCRQLARCLCSLFVALVDCTIMNDSGQQPPAACQGYRTMRIAWMTPGSIP